MIEPTQITNHYRTVEQLQEFWLFCIIVVGKNADFAASKLAKFLKIREGLVFNGVQPSGRQLRETPFEYIKRTLENNDLHNMLVASRVGQYGRIERAFAQSILLDLETCTLDDLMSIHGVGPKTARFFLVHSRPDQEYVILDTHVLAWLKEKGVDVPKSTPSGESYLRIEKVALCLFRAYFGKSLDLAAIDLLIWRKQSGRGE